MSSPLILPGKHNIHARELQKDICLALQRVYGELTYEPGDRPQLFRERLPEDVFRRLSHLILMVRNIYPFPVFGARLSFGRYASMPTSFEMLRDELGDIDRHFLRMQEASLRTLCHTEADVCSEECAETSEFCGRILLCRSSLLEIIALIELLMMNIRERARSKKMRQLRVA